MPDPLVPLSGSERSELPGAQPAAAPLDDSQVITVTVMLRRKAAVPAALVQGPEIVSTTQLGDRYGADTDDAQLVADVLGGYGLTVTEFHLPSRRLKVSGTIAAMQSAFGTTLSAVSSPHPDGSGHVQHRYRTGSLSVPAQLSGIITAVVGLDDRPAARPQFRRPPAFGSRAEAEDETGAADPAVKAGPLTAPQVASFYQFPAGTDGSGQTVAIIELGGGFTQSDLSTYFSGLGLAVPSVTAVGVDGSANTPGQDADGEVELDIQVVGGVAPGAAQVVYFGPNTDQGFIDAISDAVHGAPTPIAVSISWGMSEDQWSQQSRAAMDSIFADAAALGVTVTVAAGDNGASDDPGGQNSVHCDFPASSPNALACGGTKLVGNTTSYAISSEVVWNELSSNEGAGGGGVSDTFPLPAYQQSAGVPASANGGGSGRGVPDVAGNADPVTGYLVVVDGRQQPIGGTSAVAPLWAGLIARLAQASGKRFGLFQPLLYSGVTAGVAALGFNDVVSGSNGAYHAGPGWDACTGLGSPDGTALLARLSSTTPSTAS
ncbi:peptidase S53 [Trebonia kvetii]|uniref:Peptidase S53 n=1 Tax=Trebonia kvetii TaxID=2480626 RepID=A0A6P2C4J4_9ACTN|nr:S53 family peptidase [Trebonia kvetii]TVZ06138.1 peptidase S53 [Trebonia kvetii]